MLFRIWAPAAESVELVIGSRRHRMTPAPRGWWIVEVEAAPGDGYAYSLDGGDPLPDPRSPWQPQGVHGRSRILSEDYRWRDEDWSPPPLEEWIVYEVHVGTFTPEGTFAGAIERLDDLVSLGVNALELMPVAGFPGRHGWGYDGVDLYAPHHHYGHPDDLKRLVDGCHARGLSIVLDVVYNHLGPAGNYLGRFGPYFTDRYKTPWGDASNFDGAGSDEVREFFIDNALMWLDRYHFDALRLDAVDVIFDRSALHILEELALRVRDFARTTGRHVYLIAESDLNDPRIITPRERGGYGIDAQWSNDLHHALHAILTGERAGYYRDFGKIEQLAKALTNAYVYDGVYSGYRQRRHGRPPIGLPGRSFFGFMQNHDQIGNRALGKRIGTQARADLQKIGAALVACSPFIPLLFMGEEWAASSPFRYFTSYEDAALGRAVGEGRKREFEAFGWGPVAVPDPQDPATFEISKLDWDERETEPHRDMLEWYRSLLHLRAARPELRPAKLEDVLVRYDEEEGWILLRREGIGVACNFSLAEVLIPEVSGELLLTSAAVGVPDGALKLPPRSVAILSLHDQLPREMRASSPSSTTTVLTGAHSTSQTGGAVGGQNKKP